MREETPVKICSAAAATAIKTVSFSVGWVEPVPTASRERWPGDGAEVTNRKHAEIFLFPDNK